VSEEPDPRDSTPLEYHSATPQEPESKPIDMPGAGTKSFAAIGVGIVIVSLVIAVLLPLLLIVWMLKGC
jgi:hypothetical protein